jgi:hypothetical protein
MKWVLILFPLSCFAGFSTLNNSYEYKITDEVKTIRSSTRKTKKKGGDLNKLLKSIEESDKSIAELLKNNEKKVLVRKRDDHLSSLTRLKGILLNSVLATNRRATTLIIRLKDNEYFDEAEVRCKGLSFGKRVVGKCDLVVSDESEYQISAELWDLDGAEGIIADQFYDGSEKEFLTSSFASFFEGVLGATKDRLITPYGEVDKKNGKNQVLSGLMGIADNVNSKVKDSSEKNLQIALINSGKEVFVFFQQKVKL